MGTGSFPGVKRPGRGLTTNPHLVPSLKKEQSYSSTPSLGLRGLFCGEFYLYLYLWMLRSSCAMKMELTRFCLRLTVNTTFRLGQLP